MSQSFIQPSIFYAYPLRIAGKLESIPADSEEWRGTPWAACQFISELTQRQTNIHTHIHIYGHIRVTSVIVLCELPHRKPHVQPQNLHNSVKNNATMLPKSESNYFKTCLKYINVSLNKNLEFKRSRDELSLHNE